ncbi:MAG: zinc ribbon domain-containing protein [Desulfobacteraceae bacterium]|nr:zinc ribbon domain-containing protein [Desulfobacteraceae bacterium]
MAYETKEDLLERILNLEKPVCPHCKKEMSLWEVPDIAVGDGLGWGTPYLFVCFNDECPSFKQGWDNLQETMEHTASYRCINSPGDDNFEYMPVFSSIGGTGQVLDDDVMKMREDTKEAMRQGFSLLTDFYISKDWDEILKILLDSIQPTRVRIKAAEMVSEIADVEAIEHMVNNKFGAPLLQKAVDEAVTVLHGRHYTRECPHCAEIIKKRATTCKHCGKEVSKA